MSSSRRERRRRSAAVARQEAAAALEALRGLFAAGQGPVGPDATVALEATFGVLEWTTGTAPGGAMRQALARMLDAASEA